jgi:hypothetical protein
MRRVRGGLFVLALALAACQGVTPPTPKPTMEPLKRTTPKAATPSPEAVAETPPSSSPSVAASSAPLPARTLKKPAGVTRAILGQVQIDAYYASTVGGGRIIGNNGAQAIAFGAATLIGNNGGNIISDNGGGLIGKVKAPVPGLIGNNGSSYRVAQASSPAVAVGETMPAAGLALRVFSLRTGEILPVGEDEAGKPVYEVYSDAKGEYQLFVPETEVDNVLLVAIVPGATDARLDYSLLVPKNEARQAMDEDTSLVSDFLRLAFTDGMESDLRAYAEAATLEEALNATNDRFPAEFQDALKAMRIKLFQEAEAAGVKQYDATRRRILAQRITDAALAHMKLLEIQTDYASENLTRPEEAAVPALADQMRAMRERFRVRMRDLIAEGTDPEAYFTQDPVVMAVNAQTRPPFVLKTPADWVVFFVRGLLSNPQMDLSETRALLKETEDNPRYQVPTGEYARMWACIKPIQISFLTTFYLNAEAEKDALAAIKAGVPTP